MNARKLKQANIEILTNARMYLEYWMSTYDYNIEANCTSTLFLDHTEDVKTFNMACGGKVKTLSKMHLDAALEECLAKMPQQKRNMVAASWKCEQENLEPLKAWVRAVTGTENADDVNIIAHWVWLVKRNALDLPVVYHIVPIITSPKQGGGKSTAVNALINPVKELSLDLKLTQVTDERSFTMFADYLVTFFDEMAGVDKVEINDFKRIVTSGTLMYRPMRTNFQVSIKNRCSAIGASNSAIFDIVKDTTGIRRFFPINSLDLLDHKAINAIDYEALWKGVNEAKPRGYFELVKDIVAQKQDELAMKDEVVLFLEEHGVLPTSINTKTVNGKHLYNEYIIHTKNAGIKFPVTAQSFYKKLRGLGIQAVRKADERKVLTWYFAVNADSVLDAEKRLHAV